MGFTARRGLLALSIWASMSACDESSTGAIAPDTGAEGEADVPLSPLDRGVEQADDEGVEPPNPEDEGAEPPTPDAAPPADVPSIGVCGDGVVDPGEACDDGDEDDTNACTNACTPNISQLCAPCLGDADCGGFGGLCVPIGAGTFCGVDCEAASCPGGYACRDVMEAGVFRGRQCMPESGACAGSPCPDVDGDLICDGVDPCVADPAQDADADGVPDACDCDGPTPPCGVGVECRQEGQGFACGCPEGFEEVAGQCRDVDECARELDDCGADAVCENLEGRFSCACAEGFVGDGYTCLAATDCDPSGDDCGDNGACVVQEAGGALCECVDGFTGDGVTCEDIDECVDGGHNCDPNATCQNQIGGFTCVCNPGFQGGGVVCQDIDECGFDGHNCAQICVNTPGGFECQCEAGFTLNADGRSCDPVGEACGGCGPDAECVEGACVCRFGFEGDGQVCEAIPEGNCGACDPNAACLRDACVCRPGWTGDGGRCRDVNECTDGSADCHPTAECRNTLGGFECECPVGAVGDGVNCEVILVNECTDGSADCHPVAECFDEELGYRCACPAGYQGDGVDCQDIDECLDSPCDQTCVNTPGNFECQCEAGFGLNPDGRTCDPAANCAGDGDCHARASCVEGFCQCDEGFRGDGFTCEDIDECAEFLSGCSLRAICTNTVGGFECACPPGYEGDGTVCDPPELNACADSSECANDVLVCSEFRAIQEGDARIWEIWCRFPVEGGAAVGAACAEDADCASGLCLATANVCSVGCNDDGDCPNRMRCGYFGYSADPPRFLQMCVPDCLGSTDCAGDNICAMSDDPRTNEIDLACQVPIGALDIGAPTDDPGACRHGLALSFDNGQGQIYRGCSAPCEPSRGGADCASSFGGNPFTGCDMVFLGDPSDPATPRLNMCSVP